MIFILYIDGMIRFHKDNHNIFLLLLKSTTIGNTGIKQYLINIRQ